MELRTWFFIQVYKEKYDLLSSINEIVYKCRCNTQLANDSNSSVTSRISNSQPHDKKWLEIWPPISNRVSNYRVERQQPNWWNFNCQITNKRVWMSSVGISVISQILGLLSGISLNLSHVSVNLMDSCPQLSSKKHDISQLTVNCGQLLGISSPRPPQITVFSLQSTVNIWSECV